MKKISILVADDHAIVRTGLASILGTKKNLAVVGEAEDGEDAVRKADELHPDVILMDMVMPKMDGAEATAAILQKHPETRILVLTTFGAADGIAHAIDAGASGALMKNVDYNELVAAIHTVAEGGRVVSPEIERVFKESPPIDNLTERQRNILHSMSRGLTDADIALQFGLTKNGVREHVSTIFKKIGAANRAEAVSIAFQKHLIEN